MKKSPEPQLNFNLQEYRGIPLRLINRSYKKGHPNGSAKRFVINHTNQNVWIPNRHLHEDGTLIEGENIDYVFRRARRQLKIAGIDYRKLKGIAIESNYVCYVVRVKCYNFNPNEPSILGLIPSPVYQKFLVGPNRDPRSKGFKNFARNYIKSNGGYTAFGDSDAIEIFLITKEQWKDPKCRYAVMLGITDELKFD